MDGRGRSKRRAGISKTVRARVAAVIGVCFAVSVCGTTETLLEHGEPAIAAEPQRHANDPPGEQKNAKVAETQAIDEKPVEPAKSEAPRAEVTGQNAVTMATAIAEEPLPPSHRKSTRRLPRGRIKPLTEDQLMVLDSAYNLLGKPPECRVTVNGRHFTLDCIGTISAIFYGIGLDVTKDFSRFTGNGVGRLHKSLRDKGVLHKDKFPKPGDVIFWNNTWDANKDGNLNNDPTTHAAMVLYVEDDGTIHYVHAHVRRGVVVERMNLYRPRIYKTKVGKILNNAMALGSYFGSPKNPAHWLSGELWHMFGEVLKAKDYYKT